MATSKTDIFNAALIRVGASPVNNADTSTETRAEQCRYMYEQCIRQMGRDHPWNCLKSRAELTQDSTEPAFEWSYRYLLPVDCLRMLTLNGYTGYEVPDLYEIEGRHLLTNEEEAKIQYIAFSTDTTQFDSLFVECLTVLLASKCAMIIRQDGSMSQALRQEYERLLKTNAMKVDGNEQKRRNKHPIYESRLLHVRHHSKLPGYYIPWP